VFNEQALGHETDRHRRVQLHEYALQALAEVADHAVNADQLVDLALRAARPWI
jgi:hypothetical protein